MQTRIVATQVTDSVYATKKFLNRDFSLIMRSLSKVIHEGPATVLRPSMTSRQDHWNDVNVFALCFGLSKIAAEA